MGHSGGPSLPWILFLPVEEVPAEDEEMNGLTYYFRVPFDFLGQVELGAILLQNTTFRQHNGCHFQVKIRARKLQQCHTIMITVCHTAQPN